MIVTRQLLDVRSRHNVNITENSQHTCLVPRPPPFFVLCSECNREGLGTRLQHTSCHCSSANWRDVSTGGERTVLSRKRRGLALGNWHTILGEEEGEEEEEGNMSSGYNIVQILIHAWWSGLEV